MSLIEVACVVIFRSKLHLPHFDLNFCFLLAKHILIILLSACKFAMGTQQLVLLAAQMPVYTGDFFAAILVVIFAAILRRGPGNEDASRPGKFAPSARCHAHSAHL